MPDFDVIVVGLGPVGAVLTGLLAQRGVCVAAFERSTSLYPLPRAIGFDHELMRVMQELRIADRVLRHTAAYRPSEYHGVDGQLIKRLDMAPPPHRFGWAPNFVFDQPAFELELRQRLTELSGAQVRYGAQVCDTGQTSDGVWADVALSDGTNERFNAKYLIACDGGASPIRKRLGIELEDLDFDEPWLVVDAIVPDAKLAQLPQTQVQYCEPARPSTFVVGPGNHRRWELMLLPGESLSADYPEHELWPLLARWVKPGEVKLWRAAAYRFHGLAAKSWRSGRSLLAGDSAHMTPPFMAQGMVQGIRDALNLAWKLARVIGGDSGPALLDSYAQERIAHVKATTATAIALGRVICERDLQRARVRDAQLLAEHGGQIRTAFRQNMIPDIASGAIAADTAGAGSLLPQPSVQHDSAGGQLLDDLTGSTVRLIVSAAITGSQAARLMAALEPLAGVLVCVGTAIRYLPTGALQVRERDPVIAPWLRALGRSFAIVRPDHCVFGTASSVSGTLGLIQRLQQALEGRV